MKRRLVLHNDIREIPELAVFLEGIARQVSLEPGMVANLNLALEEAVTNVMMYAYPDGTSGLVDVQAEWEDGMLRFRITDSGTPFDPTAVPDADTSLGVMDRPIGGLGIFLIRQIMDQVSYSREEGKNILTLQKKI